MASKLPDMFEDFKQKILYEVSKKTSLELDAVAHGALSPDTIPKGQVKIEGNGYIDEVVEKLNKKLAASQLLSVVLPKQTFRFQKSIMCGIPVPGQVELLDGTVNELYDICRINEAELKIDVFNDPILIATADLGISEADVASSANITLGKCMTATHAEIRGELKGISINIEVSVNRDFTTHLDKFDVNHTGDLTIQFENLGKFDSLAETIKEIFDKTIHEAIKEYIQNTVRPLVDEIVRNSAFHM